MKNLQRIGIILIVVLFSTQIGWAAPNNSAVQKIRFSQTPEKLRIVFEMNSLPAYTVKLVESSLKLVIDMPGTVNSSSAPQMLFNDPFVTGLSLTSTEPGKLQAVVDLKMAVMYKVFTLSSPNRLVVDIIKVYEQKITEEIAPGLKNTYWLHTMPFGPITAHILDIDPKAGYILKPVLSNDAIINLETLSSMSERSQALAAVNGSYFAQDGEIIGLLKMEGEIVSIPQLPRTALGILPDGKILIDQVSYQGSVALADGSKINIDGVNCERGPDGLVIYNKFFGMTTDTNEFGMEYVVSDGKVTAISPSNTTIIPGSIVLSAHGAAQKKLAGLKIGDTVNISQTIDPEWDKTLYALGAGPTLIKNNSIFLTTKTEEFGSDVAGGRAPRTALGVKANGHILLAVVDGRQSSSMGLSLLELAQLMQELGVVDALNLDGGGSSEMVVKNKVVNNPSDGRERSLGDALGIFPAQLAN